MLATTDQYPESIAPHPQAAAATGAMDPAAQGSPVQCHWLTKPEDFLPWLDAWRDLLRRSPVPVTAFHDPAWILGCWHCPRNRLAVGLISQGSRLRVGIVCNSEGDAGHAVLLPVTLLSLTSHISAAVPARLIAVADDDPPAEINLILSHAVRHFRWQVLFLNYLDPSVAWIESAVRASAAAHGWRIREGESSTDAFVSTAGGLEGYRSIRGSSGKARYNQRRARAQLEAEGTLTAVELARTDIPNETIFTELVDNFERCWQRDTVNSPLHKVVRPHLLSLLAEMRAAGLLRVYLLRLNDWAIAFEFGFVDRHAGGLYYVCARGYDEVWSHQSPGNILTEFTIEDTFAAGLRGIYLGPIQLSADNAYKKAWLTEEWHVRNISIIRPRSAYGLIDTFYEKSALFRRIWWKLRLGERLRRLYWFLYGPTG